MILKTLKITFPKMRGEIVKYAQELLTQAGYDCGEIDGIWGTKCKKACEAFQYDHRLEKDGICGKQTWAALELVTKTEDEKAVEVPEDPSVLEIQTRLIEWGFGMVVGMADGKMGSKTKTAIKQFQCAMGLQPDGVVGKQTKAALWDAIIIPRISDEAMKCQCTATGYNYCNGYPMGKGYGISVRILAERIFRECEKKYPGTEFYITTHATPTPNGSNAGGYRCSKWNSKRGGASGSQHKKCLGMDIYGIKAGVSRYDIRQHLEDIAMKLNKFGGVGYGAKYIVHIDTRCSKARWKY